jgi:hypothetical protein
MFNKRQTLEQWIREALADPEKDNPCSAIALTHIENGIESEIYTVKLNAGRAWEPQGLAELLRHKSEGFSQDSIGVQKFRVLAFYGSPEAEARFPFIVQGRLSYDSDGTTEAPTETGKVQQNMRLTEAIVQGSFRQNAYTYDVIKDMFREVIITNRALNQDNQKLIETIQVLALEKSQSTHTFRIEEMKLQRENMMIEEVAKMLPGVMNKLTGKEIFPQQAVDTALIEKLALSLDESQFEKIAQLGLPQDLVAMLGQRVVQVLKSKKQLSNGSANGSANPNGASHVDTSSKE